MSDSDSDANALYQEQGHKMEEVERKEQSEEPSQELDEEQQDDDSAHLRRAKHSLHKGSKRRQVIKSNFIQEEASESDEEEFSQEEGSEERQAMQMEQKRYSNEPRLTQLYLKKLQNKQDDEINQQFRQKAKKLRENEQMLPTQRDHKMFSVLVRPGQQEQLVLSILVKAAYVARTADKRYQMQITTAFAFKKKYRGKIFVEAASQKDIRQSLQNFVDVNLTRITPLDDDFYVSLLTTKQAPTTFLTVNKFVRVKKGLYQGDLGRIWKVNKRSVSVALVPRFNVQDVAKKMREEIARIQDDETADKYKKAILKKYLSPRISYPPHLRPSKKLLYEKDFSEWAELSSVGRIQLLPQGLMVVSFAHDQVMRIQGTPTALELQPFYQPGHLLEELEDQRERKNLQTTVHLNKDDEVQIIAGQLSGCHGVVVQVLANTVVMRCRNKPMKHKIVEEHLNHVCKYFRESQNVRVAHGADQGKTGLILSLDGQYAKILTDNGHELDINKNNLQLSRGQAICTDNVLAFKKEELIKTTTHGIGIVLSVQKDTIRMLDTINVVHSIPNLDFESKIMAMNLTTQNKNGDVIKTGTIVRIKKGVREDKQCEVKHVYRDYVFMFNAEFDRTTGLCVEKAQNLTVIAAAPQKQQRRGYKPPSRPQTLSAVEPTDSWKVGQSIVLPSGPLKGYRGLIKSLTKDKIEVRVMQKGCTEWISRTAMTAPQESLDIGKTPRRNLSNTVMYAQSPMTY